MCVEQIQNNAGNAIRYSNDSIHTKLVTINGEEKESEQTVKERKTNKQTSIRINSVVEETSCHLSPLLSHNYF